MAGMTAFIWMSMEFFTKNKRYFWFPAAVVLCVSSGVCGVEFMAAAYLLSVALAVRLRAGMAVERRAFIAETVQMTVLSLLSALTAAGWTVGIPGLFILLPAGAYLMSGTGEDDAFLQRGLPACACMLLSLTASVKRDVGVLMYVTSLAWFFGLCSLPRTRRAFRIWFVFILTAVFLLRIANHYFFMYRCSVLGVQDILGVGTLLKVADGYRFKPDSFTHFVTACYVVIMLSFAFMPDLMPFQLKPIYRRYAALLAVASFILFGIHGYIYPPDLKKNEKLLDMEALSVSVIDQVRFMVSRGDMDGLQRIRDRYPGLPACHDVQPSILLVQCESFADPEEVFGLDYERDPLAAFRSVHGKDVCKGNIRVNTFGGGTSVTEWEVLNGLDSSVLGLARSPFLSIGRSRTLLDDGFYDGYERVLLHPGFPTAYARDRVYEGYGYARRLFCGDMPPFDGGVSPFRPDRDLYRLAEDIIGQSDVPVFLSCITLECHGDYIYEVSDDRLIRTAEGVHSADIYGTVLCDAADAVKELVDYYRIHREKPVLIIFYGDHAPYLNVPGKTLYKTPYMVFSNFCDIGYMPGEIDSCRLIPYARRAAGLGLGFWEHYLVEGGVLDAGIEVARLENHIG